MKRTAWNRHACSGQLQLKHVITQGEEISTMSLFIVRGIGVTRRLLFHTWKFSPEKSHKPQSFRK